jgi:hypothetical protein
MIFPRFLINSGQAKVRRTAVGLARADGPSLSPSVPLSVPLRSLSITHSLSMIISLSSAPRFSLYLSLSPVAQRQRITWRADAPAPTLSRLLPDPWPRPTRATVTARLASQPPQRHMARCARHTQAASESRHLPRQLSVTQQAQN